ncbi:MAG: DUF3302 domain-containing protein [Gammaproteobacteria bacterium]|nr:DUF3302 domain-containing protein [Gammaproteobacteria bacterium]
MSHRNTVCAAAAGAGLLAAEVAHASFLSGETLDKMADIVALVVLVFVPILVIVLFWLVHILPEKIAEERHHPQKDAIKVLCLLSLVFGGLLWPIAWIMAYSKPVLYKLAYGRDKHDDYYKEALPDAVPAPKPLGDEVTRWREELDALGARGPLPLELQEMRDRLKAFEARVAPPPLPPDSREGAG